MGPSARSLIKVEYEGCSIIMGYYNGFSQGRAKCLNFLPTAEMRGVSGGGGGLQFTTILFIWWTNKTD